VKRLSDFTSSRLWQISLAQQDEDGDEKTKEAKERLRKEFLSFRKRANYVATEIGLHSPGLTQHDPSHIDALWSVADLIAGPALGLNPAEGFVLGGAFLLHDLGNGLAAYPEGIEALKKEPFWRDTVAREFTRRIGRPPEPDESIDSAIEAVATERALRRMHAQKAEKLGLIFWRDRDKDEQQYLIEDSELRRTYGSVIGRIAYSHWVACQDLKQMFPTKLGAPYWAPSSWTVDPLKIACILRLADAAHLDGGRAPAFLRALRHPNDDSRRHWLFQERLQKPHLSEDRLIFTSGLPFTQDEASAWWLCLDSLRMVDDELRKVDALLADLERPRMAARGVAGVDHPMRLTEFVPTDGWLPVDARVKANDVIGLVRKLGGQELYGADPTIPLRELIQNGCDAVRARRTVDGYALDWGEVCVRLGKDADGDWIEVEDNGVGMSEDLLCGPLLDFGTSYWGTDLCLDEHPGLLDKGFQPTGKYGIGFYSVFMLGSRVQVITRRYLEDAAKDTRVLEFEHGPASRPLLRPARPDEYRKDGGTRVRVWLDTAPTAYGGLLHSNYDEGPWSLNSRCAWLCPTLDVSLTTQENGGPLTSAVRSNDWIDMNGLELLTRIMGPLKRPSPDLSVLASNLQVVKDQRDRAIGRICLQPLRDRGGDLPMGIVTVGGLRSSRLAHIAGVLVGLSQNASRLSALPVIDQNQLITWANEQVPLVCKVVQDEASLVRAAQAVCRIGADPQMLPIATSTTGPISFDGIAQWDDAPNEVFIMNDYRLDMRRDFGTIRLLHHHVLGASGSVPSVLPGSSRYFDWPRSQWLDGPLGSVSAQSAIAAVIRALCRRWDSTLDEVLAASQTAFTEEEVGIDHMGNPILERVIVVRHPKAGSVS
jgi:hypothetical protein